jgi:hypothetical protein
VSASFITESASDNSFGVALGSFLDKTSFASLALFSAASAASFAILACANSLFFIHSSLLASRISLVMLDLFEEISHANLASASLCFFAAF